jgi:HTH-type transcriptional regulator / antitoxin MqsA
MTTKSCAACGSAAMVRDTRDTTKNYKGEEIAVPAVEGWHCPDCGEIEFATSAGAKRYSDAVSVAMDAINTAEQAKLRATRKRLGLKQGEAAAIFGGGVNAFSEYERGIRQPSKSTLLLLQLLDRHPELLAEVRQAA